MVFPFIFESVPFEHLRFGVNFLLDPSSAIVFRCSKETERPFQDKLEETSCLHSSYFT